MVDPRRGWVDRAKEKSFTASRAKIGEGLAAEVTGDALAAELGHGRHFAHARQRRHGRRLHHKTGAGQFCPGALEIERAATGRRFRPQKDGAFDIPGCFAKDCAPEGKEFVDQGGGNRDRIFHSGLPVPFCPTQRAFRAGLTSRRPHPTSLHSRPAQSSAHQCDRSSTRAGQESPTAGNGRPGLAPG